MDRRGPLSRLRRRKSLRIRFTLWLGGMFLVLGIGLLALNYALLDNQLHHELRTEQDAPPPPPPPHQDDNRSDAQRAQDRDDIRRDVISDTLRSTLAVSGIAFVIMAAVSFVLGWIVSDRMLRPINRMTEAARNLSETNLDERLDVEGPEDELRELAETFNAMLARLDIAFNAQKEFVANASHELRTPLTLMRTEVEVALDGLADPGEALDREDYLDTLTAIRTAGLRAEELIDRLLTLARTDGTVARDDVDLADVAESAIALARPALDEAGVEAICDLDDVEVLGDRPLLERLVGNLVENAARYNVPDGWIRVRSAVSDGKGLLEVSNSGDTIAQSEVADLFGRFKRREKSRDRRTGGFGLGLAIVESVAQAHNGSIEAEALDAGGLSIRVRLPLA